MPQVLSRDGNVLAVDFGAPAAPATPLAISAKVSLLYCDQFAWLFRISYFRGNELLAVQNVMTDIPTNMDVSK